MRKASTRLLEQGTQTPSPAPDLIPAETSTENLHWDWYSKRGHFSRDIVESYRRPLRVTLCGGRYERSVETDISKYEYMARNWMLGSTVRDGLCLCPRKPLALPALVSISCEPC
jgi:hypothetical protein